MIKASRISKYNRLATARSSQVNRVKGSMVILGDDGLFWVVTLGDGAKLLKAGYELAV